jgi:sugar phosphate isomerase/epimerase
MKHIDKLDPRIGLCIDVGHSYRASEDPATAIRSFAARVHDIHMKDSVAVPGAVRDIPVEGGQGRIDFPGIFTALKSIRYNGVVTYEYERNTPNPVPGLAESMGYARGVLKMLASA